MNLFPFYGPPSPGRRLSVYSFLFFAKFKTHYFIFNLLIIPLVMLVLMIFLKWFSRPKYFYITFSTLSMVYILWPCQMRHILNISYGTLFLIVYQALRKETLHNPFLLLFQIFSYRNESLLVRLFVRVRRRK